MSAIILQGYGTGKRGTVVLQGYGLGVSEVAAVVCGSVTLTRAVNGRVGVATGLAATLTVTRGVNGKVKVPVTC
jgi:hypothetical protein